jgi:hypothetical protein
VKQNNRNIYYPIDNIGGRKAVISFSLEVLKRFPENKLESWLSGIGEKIGDLYKVDSPTLYLNIPDISWDSSLQECTKMYIDKSIGKAFFKFPFPSEAVKILYKTLNFSPIQTEQESSSISENKPESSRETKITRFLPTGNENGGV